MSHRETYFYVLKHFFYFIIIVTIIENSLGAIEVGLLDQVVLTLSIQ